MTETLINTQILYAETADKLRLQGFHFDSEKRDICVLVVHGMSGSFLENFFAIELGRVLSSAGFGCVCGHNRGMGFISTIPMTTSNENGGRAYKTIGSTYERFEDSILDIDAWLTICRNLGYKRLVLLGHSLGCNKVIHYLARKNPDDVVGIVLASPPDMVGLMKLPESVSTYTKFLNEALTNVEQGAGSKRLSTLIWDYSELSSQTFLDLFTEGGPADNLPVLRNPAVFEELSVISVPILGLMGENDDIEIRKLDEDLDLIASKAVSCPDFSKQFISGANHTYDFKEQEFGKVILNWLQKTF